MDERKKMNQGEKTGKERTSCGLDAGQIRQGLSPFWQGLAVQVHEVVTSTNDLAKKEAREGRPVLVAACQQTAGRGRRGRSFYSPAGTGLYFSLAFPWEEEVPPTLLTPLAALAAAEVLEDLVEAPIGIKWVNDLYLGGKKIAGILTEAVTRLPKEAGVFLVLGLGNGLGEETLVELVAECVDVFLELVAAAGHFLIDAVDFGLHDAAELVGHIVIAQDGVEVEIDDGASCGCNFISLGVVCCVLA